MCNLLEPLTEEQKSNKSIGSPHNVTVSENTWHVRCQCWLRNVDGEMYRLLSCMEQSYCYWMWYSNLVYMCIVRLSSQGDIFSTGNPLLCIYCSGQPWTCDHSSNPYPAPSHHGHLRCTIWNLRTQCAGEVVRPHWQSHCAITVLLWWQCSRYATFLYSWLDHSTALRTTSLSMQELFAYPYGLRVNYFRSSQY